jgi:hypothetical protein
MFQISQLVYRRGKHMKKLAIACSAEKLTQPMIEWLVLGGAKIEEGEEAVIHLPITAHLVQISAAQFQLDFLPLIPGRLLIGLDINIYCVTLGFINYLESEL